MHRSRIIENSMIDDFVISEEDMQIISNVNQKRCGNDPNNFNFG